MKVFVIIVTYNATPWLDRCFGSLSASTARPTVLVVDNGSTDGTVERLTRDFPEVEVLVASRNLGFGQANNVALRMAHDRGADYYFLLNQDAWVEPDTLDHLIHASRSEPGFAILSPMHLNGKGDALDYFFSRCIAPERCAGLVSDMYLGMVRDRVYATSNVNAAAWLMTKECIEVVGGFNPSFFHYGEDDNYIARVAYHGFRVGVLPSVRIYHDREHRPEGAYFDDRIEYNRRITIREMADPRDERDAFHDIRILDRLMFKTLLRMNWKARREFARRRKALLDSDLPAVVRNRASSRKRGMTFLDMPLAEGVTVARASG